MARVIFREERCKGCRLCTAVCPRGIIKMSGRINEMELPPGSFGRTGKLYGLHLMRPCLSRHGD